MGGPHVCRLCAAPLEHVFVDLGVSPLANSYVKPADLDRPERFFPLTVYVCDKCLLVQLPESASAEAIFGEEYLYFSAFSTSWLDHCSRYVGMMIERFGIGPESLVVEVASNDGCLLQYYKQRGVRVLGIEPAGNVAKVAIEERGIPTLVEFFGERSAARIRGEGRSADCLVANNVFAHVPNLHDFVNGIRTLLAPHGVATFEFPHMMKLIEETQYDTIYHEHYSYFSLHTAERALGEHALRIFDVEEIPTHGGSLRLFVCHDGDASKATTARVPALRAREKERGLHDLATYLAFAPAVHGVKWDLLEFLIGVRRRGKRVAAYGAAAKGNTLLNYCGVRGDLIEFAVDRSPHKQGHLLPGTRIPIYGPEKVFEVKPDYLLILPWNLKSEIMEQMAGIAAWGGRFVMSLPKLQIV
jgi:SAM-dependent methyltransferase